MRHVSAYIPVAAATLLCLVTSTGNAGADNYFIDGYHGGIYGHYPVAWKTQFIVDQLKSHPQWYVGLEIEPETWDTVSVRTPEAFREFSRLLKEGRMEYTNPTYAQPYCYNISGESIIRQFAYGISSLRRHFPGITFSTYSCEEPCFTSCLPAILRGFGFSYASLKCPDTCWGGYMAPYGGQTVNWIGPDGSSLLTVPRYACESLKEGTVWQTIAWAPTPEYLDACRRAGIVNPIGMTYQDAGWRKGPWLGASPAAKYILWTDYITAHTDPAAATDYPLTQDDVRVNLMWGSQVMQRIARRVRRAENRLLMAEKMGAVVLPGGVAAPDSVLLDEAWRRLMLAQHHDSWIVPYNGLWHFGTWADAIRGWTAYADSAATASMQTMAAALTPGRYAMVKVFNTGAYPRTEVVQVPLPAGWGDAPVAITDARGHRVDAQVITGAAPRDIYSDNTQVQDTKAERLLTFSATVPPSGWATYRLSRPDCKIEDAGETAPGTGQVKDSNEVILENERFRLILDLRCGGTLKNLVLKHADGHRGQLQEMEFAPAEGNFSIGELRGFFYDEGRFRSSAETPARLTEFVNTPLLTRATVAGEIAGHPYTQTYTLRKGSPRIDCALHIDWQGNPGIGEYRERHWNHDRRGFCDDRYKLLVLFPTNFAQTRLLKDAPFDICESRDSSTVFNRWSEIKHNVILNWAHVDNGASAPGLGIITDHTTSYVHGGGIPLSLTLQYSGQGLWGPDYRINGPLDVEYAIVPHTGDAASAMEDAAESFNEPLQAFFCGGDGKPSEHSLLSVSAPGYRLSSADARGGELHLRFYNSHAQTPATVTADLPGLRSVQTTDLMGENPADSPAKLSRRRASWQLDMPRQGIATYALH